MLMKLRSFEVLQKNKREPNGNPRALFGDILKDRIQNDLHSKGLLPKMWIGHMDEIFTILHIDKVEEMLEVPNKVHRN